jgi:hypothetical protein
MQVFGNDSDKTEADNPENYGKDRQNRVLEVRKRNFVRRDARSRRCRAGSAMIDGPLKAPICA